MEISPRVHLELTEAEWFQKPPNRRKQYINTRVQNTFLEDAQAEILGTTSLQSTSFSHDPEPVSLLPKPRSSLSNDVNSFAQGLTVPLPSFGKKLDKGRGASFV